MDRHYSTLELVKHDNTASAPERDHDAAASELDASRSAPEVFPATTPQVFYNPLPPEATKGATEFEDRSQRAELVPSRFRFKKPWMIAVTTAIIIVATALGVGVGVWQSRKQSNSATTGLILNDTSLAVESLPNGDRHLFFQERNALVRRVVLTASTGQWTLKPKLNISSTAKKRTPLAVTFDQPPDGPPQFHLYYVSNNLSLSTSFEQRGLWYADNSLATCVAANDTRSLSVVSINSTISPNAFPINDGVITRLLYYQNRDGDVNVLVRYARECTWVGCSIENWLDASGQANSSAPLTDTLNSVLYNTSLYGVSQPAVLGTPFTSTKFNGPHSIANDSNFESLALFYSPSVNVSKNSPAQDGVVSVDFGGVSFTSHSAQEIGNEADHIFIKDSDIAIIDMKSLYTLTSTEPFSIWIDQTKAAPLNYQSSKFSMPNKSFPFSRLASVTPPDGSTTFLYHQINETTIAEEQWDTSFKYWAEPSYIHLDEP